MPDSRIHILIADDEPLFLRTTAALLEEAGYRCTCAPDGNHARQVLADQRVDLILTDLNMPGNRQLELLREGRGQWPETPLIVITGAPSLPSAIESVRLGIADYLLKPVKYQDLLSSIQRALRPRTLPPSPAPDAAGDRACFREVIGESAAMRQVFEIMDRVAESDANVLITGESGTGKEVVAGAIHRRSSRREYPFQVIDCTSIPETLFESVLFGHARGAFTGAVRDQVGLLRQAHGGTAFFDEIGELPSSLQAKLLRVIQEPIITPLGKTQSERVDARFICATNRNLLLEVNTGGFRRDLFYRLAVIHIELPPLRDRGDDVLLLADHFLRQLKRPDQAVEELAPATKKLLQRYSWPGNVRELRNAIEHGLTLTRGKEILPDDLPQTVQQGVPPDTSVRAEPVAGTSRERVLRGAEREYLENLLRENRGNVARSAQQAGISRQGLHKLLKKHGVEPGEYRR